MPKTKPRSSKKKPESATNAHSSRDGKEQDQGHSSHPLNSPTADSTSRGEGRGNATRAAPRRINVANDGQSPRSAPPPPAPQVPIKKDFDWIDSFLQLLSFAAAIVLSSIILKHTKLEWLMDQLSKEGEEALPAKTSVVIFFMFWYCFVAWMDKALLTIKFLVRIGFPDQHFQIARFAQNWSFLFPMTYPYYYQVLLPFTTYYGAAYWHMIWQRFICKTRYDKSCQNTSLGILLSNYRKEGCAAEDGSYSMLCDRMIAILPFFFLCLVAVVIGVVLQTIFNDFLQEYIQKDVFNKWKQQIERESESEGGTRANPPSPGGPSRPREDETESETSEANSEQVSDSE